MLFVLLGELTTIKLMFLVPSWGITSLIEFIYVLCSFTPWVSLGSISQSHFVNNKIIFIFIWFCCTVSDVALKRCDVAKKVTTWRTCTQSAYNMRTIASFQTALTQVLINLIFLRSSGRRSHPHSIIKGNLNKLRDYKD